jgi:hypothetical protein
MMMIIIIISSNTKARVNEIEINLFLKNRKKIIHYVYININYIRKERIYLNLISLIIRGIEDIFILKKSSLIFIHGIKFSLIH